MIAVPREDGGVTVHGSLQCPYYIHKAMKRALNMGDELAVVVQAETGGGFGGKEEYPSVIALHAALLALKCHKPVRMIYDRHEDISATTKRHPAVVRYRTRRQRHRRAGRAGDRGHHGRRRVLHADAGRAVARRAARRRPVSVRERADHRSRDGDQHAAQRRIPRLRRAADRVRGRDADQPHRRCARRIAARPSPALGLPRGRRHAHRPGAARERGRDRGARGGRGRVGVRPDARADPVDARGPHGRRADGPRHRPGAGLAWRRLHRLRRGQAGIGRLARADR